MFQGKTVAVLIPAFNEEHAIAKVIKALPSQVDCILVADNNSSDQTAKVATKAGATVTTASQQGYGSACLAGAAHLRQNTPPDILVFLDGDFADDPTYLPQLIEPILTGHAKLVIGSRKAMAEAGSLTAPQKFGNWLACSLIHLIWRKKFTDLGPFRAITWPAYEALNMQDTNYGWTVEMQIKAAKQQLTTAEISVPYRPRIGTSKISGTLKGTVLAGTKILYLIGRSVFKT